MAGTDSSLNQNRTSKLAEGGIDPSVFDAFSAVPVGVGLILDRVIFDINDWALSIVGYKREEVLGKSTRMLFIDEAEYDRVGRDLYAKLRDQGFCEIESQYRKKDGSPVDVLIRGTPLDRSDPLRGIIYVVLDISDRKRVERALESRVFALTRPLEQGAALLRFEDLFNLADIQRIQDAFADATGVASLITTTEGVPITNPSNFCRLCAEVIRGTEKGLLNCMKSDTFIGTSACDGPTLRPCLSGGLWDGGARIMVGNTQIASWLIGQVLDESADMEVLRAYAREIGADQKEFDAALGEVTRMSRSRFEKACVALDLIAGQLSNLAFNNVQQARAIAERRRAEEELRDSAERLRSALEEREALYKELKHRVKNSMALMAGLVGLESSHAENEEVQTVLSNMRTRIDSFAALYDLLGQEGNPNAVRIDSYLSHIIDSITVSFVLEARVDFSLDFEPISISARTAAPIGLVIMELVTNALKYAFPNNRCGQVSVSLKRAESGGFRCSVEDDGVGLPADFDPGRDGGLGMELIGMLVGQLKGKWLFEPCRGTRAVISLPPEGPPP